LGFFFFFFFLERKEGGLLVHEEDTGTLVAGARLGIKTSGFRKHKKWDVAVGPWRFWRGKSEIFNETGEYAGSFVYCNYVRERSRFRHHTRPVSHRSAP
jgi:hypothetical protein